MRKQPNIAEKKRRYLTFKSLRYLIILFIIISFNFLIPRIMPGDPVKNILGESLEVATPEEEMALKIRYGLDKPLPLQYIKYLQNIIRLDFGYSIISERAVNVMIAEALKYTLILVFPAVLLSGAISLFLGTIAGYKRNSLFDKTVTSLSLILYTTPSFFLSMIALSIFSYHLDWFPLGQLSSGGTTGIGFIMDLLWHMVLPVSVLTIFGSLSKYMVIRGSTTQILNEHFIFVLKAKGFSRNRIVFRHVVKNIFPQFLSMMALSFGFMVSGSLLVEIVFSIDGMGGLIHRAVTTRDYPVLQGAFLVITVTVLLANLVADMLYAVTDPRISDSQESGHQI